MLLSTPYQTFVLLRLRIQKPSDGHFADPEQTNVPTIRLAYRQSTLLEELALIHHGHHSPQATPTHLKPAPVPAPGTVQGVISSNRPGMTTHASDLGAAAMASSAGSGVGVGGVGGGGGGGGGSGVEGHLVGSLEERGRMRGAPV